MQFKQFRNNLNFIIHGEIKLFTGSRVTRSHFYPYFKITIFSCISMCKRLCTSTLQWKFYLCIPFSGNCAASGPISKFMCLWEIYIFLGSVAYISCSRINRQIDHGKEYINRSLSRESGEEDQSAAGLLLRTYSAGPVSQTCLLRSKRRELQRTVTLDDSTPQRRISELRVWSYEPFIVPGSSSSGYLSGQNLEVLYIIINSIWNIFKIFQKIIKKYEIVLKQKLDTVSYLEEQKISAGLHPE